MPLAALAAGVVLGGLVPASAWAEGRAAGPDAQRTAVLGADYRRSGDTAWTTSGDARGFHLLTARERDGYAWQTTATLSEPGGGNAFGTCDVAARGSGGNNPWSIAPPVPLIGDGPDNRPTRVGHCDDLASGFTVNTTP
ncbi:hypothetical protein LG634_09205 [Streptomyces bambusae]|uniref:hypothetical protein n=1 Tax=Streptomyces bambusae TaxID=1550616 RepID=UPI001CFF4D66|nr:hypothetical protein [Streptomyces bambusae]MCB5165004.1 hypothetical protein [Streptomyces bambusae]